MNSNSRFKSEDLDVKDITNCLNDLKYIYSFFILERGNCSYLQCINYKDNILIEERIYSENGFKHFVLAKDPDYYVDYTDHVDYTDYTDSTDLNTENNSENKLTIDDDNFKRFSNELFSIKEAIDIFTDYYTNIPFKHIIKRDMSNEFGTLENGFVFIKWLNSAADNFKENLDEFVERIEPFVIDELKKDCIGYKISFEKKIKGNVNNINNNENKENNNIENKNNNVVVDEKEENNIKCSAFKVIDIKWAAESIVEIASKYEFLEDIILFKKNKLNNEKFFKLNLEDFKN